MVRTHPDPISVFLRAKRQSSTTTGEYAATKIGWSDGDAGVGRYPTPGYAALPSDSGFSGAVVVD